MIHTVPDMQVGTALYEGRHRHDDPYRVLNRRPVAEPAADHRPRHAAPEPSTRVEPYEDRRGIGWKCRDCGATWSGSREHTCDPCTADSKAAGR